MPRDIPKGCHANLRGQMARVAKRALRPIAFARLNFRYLKNSASCMALVGQFAPAVALSAIASNALAQVGEETVKDTGYVSLLYDTLSHSASRFFSAGGASGELVLLALFGGAMSFALMAAFWLIRDRNKSGDENKKLRHSLASFKAVNERYEALIRVDDQCILVWQGQQDEVEIIGSLPPKCINDLDRSNIPAFGKWLASESSGMLERAVMRLRDNAESFDISLQTKSGRAVDAQGRTSGSHAFVRFLELTGERAALANLEQEHGRLLATFESVQSLFDRLDLPVWLSGKVRDLYWVNEAYCQAVDSNSVLDVVEQNICLFDAAQRDQISSRREDDGYFHGRLPATWAGDRRMLEVYEIQQENRGVGIAVDRSEVEHVRALLKQTVTSHSNTLDHLATPIAIFDADKNLEFFNSSFQTMWKLDTEFLETKPSNSAILDAMRDKGRLPSQADWRSWRSEQLSIYQALEPREEWWHLSDGQTVRVVVNPQNQGGAAWIFEDVTEELELKSSYNAVLRVQGETLDHLNEAVAVFGSDGKLRLSNPAFTNMLNLSEGVIQTDQHISAVSTELATRINEDGVWDDIVTAITGLDDARNTGSGRLSLNDGRIMEFTLVPLPDGQTMLTLLDVTSTVKFETALTERNEALEEAGRIKNKFLQHVSYELRTPLTTIAGFGEMMGMEDTGTLNATQREYMSHINASSASLKAIIDDILDLATIDAGAMELELQKFDAEKVIRDVVTSLKSRLDEHAVTVSLDLEGDACELIADQTRFRQIMFNVISNALDHTPDGTVISVAAHRDQDQTLYSVTDHGPGIDEAQAQNIFSRFESGGGRGAGLGLSIVRSFMQLHNGEVIAENAEGRGARFICKFPNQPDQSRQAAQ